MRRPLLPAILLLHCDYLHSTPSTIVEHVNAFERYSRFPVVRHNVAFGFPPPLEKIEFAAVVFHYSLSPTFHWLSEELKDYLLGCDRSYKVAIFQDEIWYFAERFRFLNEFDVDCLYTRHKPQHVQDVYGETTRVRRFVHYMAGYVSPRLIEATRRHARPWEDRGIDVAYRGRRLPYYLGRACQEKADIGLRFRELVRSGLNARASQLRIDIDVDEDSRLYGEDWDRFLGNARAVLGVEGGASVIDPSGEIRRECERLLELNPRMTFDEFAEALGERLALLEGKVSYRAFTPRHFEAAAFQCIQVLFEGAYDGLIDPHVHYLPLKKDFSNFDEIVEQLHDSDLMRRIRERAFADLIDSGRYTYERFIGEFDHNLSEAGLFVSGAERTLLRRTARYVHDWELFSRQKLRYQALRYELSTHPAVPDRLLDAANRRFMADADRRIGAHQRMLESQHIARYSSLKSVRETWRGLQLWSSITNRPQFNNASEDFHTEYRERNRNLYLCWNLANLSLPRAA